MNNLVVFNEQEVLGKNFKMYGDKENPLFLAKDVAEWIEERDGYTISRKVDEEEKVLHTICVAGQNREMTFLTEDGFYEVLMLSRKPIAKQFKKEVKKILKQIRQTGGYIPISQEESEEDLMARAFIIAQKTLARREAQLKQAQAEILVLEDENKNLKAFLGNDEIFSKATLANKLDTHPTVMAKILKDCGVYTKTCQVSESFKEKYPDIKITKDVDVPYFHPTIGRTFKTDWQWTKEGAFEVIKYLKEIGLVTETQNGEFKIVKL